jgi:transcriptional regulator with XRE-family HTH domain/tetratricopeptide (TPR) repeat protein
MDRLVSFGSWVRRRRKLLDLTQADLARQVSCSLSMLRKIERDERRPSDQLAELLADSLALEDSQRDAFVDMARGRFIRRVEVNAESKPDLIHARAGLEDLRRAQAPFVARDRELRGLHEYLKEAIGGQGRLVFVSGEAGRGKTALLCEFARQAMDAWPDLLVAGGSSDVYTGLGDPLLPFRDVFRLLTGDINSPGMRGLISPELAARLARTLPDTMDVLLEHGFHLIDTLIPAPALEARLAETTPQLYSGPPLLLRLQQRATLRPGSAAPGMTRDSLFEAISTTLMALARRHPLLLLFDDLHWLDPSSAALLGHLLMRLQHSPILILGSFRPEDLAQRRPASEAGQETAHPLRELLSESRRQFGHNRLDLVYLDPEEELAFVNALLNADDNDFGPDFRQRFARLTEGHALFVVELLSDMKERGDVTLGSDGRWMESDTIDWEQIPARVDGVVEKRIGRLSKELRDVLAVASVQGETFFAEVVSQVRQVDPRTLTYHLSTDLDRRHRLIREQGVTHAGSQRLSLYEFRHQLFQKYLYGRLAGAQRMYLHEDVGYALEALYTDPAVEDEVPAAQLARHFQEAQLAAKASRYLLLAGEQAARVFAYDEAAADIERGLRLLEDLAPSPEITGLAFELLLALGRVYWHGGRLAEALRAHEKAIRIARDLDEPQALARAVLAYEEPRWRLSLPEESSQYHVRLALAALGDDESPLGVRLLVALARALLASGEQGEIRTIVEQALRLARAGDDPLALADALFVSAQIDRRPETTEARLAAVEELITLARSIGDRERLADALDLYTYDHLELGHIDLVDEAIAAQKQIAQEIKQPFQSYLATVLQTTRAIMKGQYDEAERLANAAADLGRQIGIADMDGIFGIHMFTIRWQQGRLHEVAPILKLYVEANPSSTSWRPGLALIYCALELRDESRTILDELMSDGFAFAPQDSLQVASLAYLAEVCASLEARDQAAVLYELLLPYDGRTIVVGGGTACYGAAGRYLGMLATTLADWPAAERHFEGALALDARMGSRPWLAHGEYEYAAMLLARGQAGDEVRALALLEESMAAAREMGMANLVRKVDGLRERYALA